MKNVGRIEKNSGHLTLDSGTIIHIRGSKILPTGRGFYYLLEEDYEDAINKANTYFVIV
jgi:hypothetical protein